MDLHELSFAKIIVLREDIAEVVVNEGVEMNMAMLEEYHDFLLSNLRHPFSLLINKVNSYTYDFATQINLATLKEINALAIDSYSRITKACTESLASRPRAADWNLKIFSNRAEALAWLESEQGESNKSLHPTSSEGG